LANNGPQQFPLSEVYGSLHARSHSSILKTDRIQEIVSKADDRSGAFVTLFDHAACVRHNIPQFLIESARFSFFVLHPC
jgi:hypothetical protein